MSYDYALHYSSALDPAPYRQPGWLAETVSRLGQSHPLSGVLQQAIAEGGTIYGHGISMGRRNWPSETAKPEVHDLGGGVFAHVVRQPLEESAGYDRVEVQLHHPESGRRGWFSVNQKR